MDQSVVSAHVMPHDHVVFTEFDGGEGVLVDLNAKRYYQLNETAVIIWRALEQNRPAPEIIGELTNAYEVTPEHAASSLNTLLRSLMSYKLIHPRE